MLLMPRAAESMRAADFDQIVQLEVDAISELVA
jgi:hypothetical protein